LSPACCLAEAKQLSSGSRSLTLYFVCKLTSPERANRLAPPFPAIDISDWDVGFARVVTLSSSLEIERNLDAFAKLAGIQKTSSSANTFFYNQDFPHPLSPWMTMCWLPSKRCFSAASRSPRATYMLSFTSAFLGVKTSVISFRKNSPSIRRILGHARQSARVLRLLSQVPA
jgi:hypothetical protein